MHILVLLNLIISKKINSSWETRIVTEATAGKISDKASILESIE